jgi:hypothetical protein
MKLRSCRILFSIAFEVEVLGVLIALLPVGVFAACTVNNGRWFHQEPTVELAPSVTITASETGMGQVHSVSSAMVVTSNTLGVFFCSFLPAPKGTKADLWCSSSQLTL